LNVLSLAAEKDFSRKGAKAQSAAAFPKGFLCAFAPLREKSFFRQSNPQISAAKSGKKRRPVPVLNKPSEFVRNGKICGLFA
jgi:hypothetical protein